MTDYLLGHIEDLPVFGLEALFFLLGSPQLRIVLGVMVLGIRGHADIMREIDGRGYVILVEFDKATAGGATPHVTITNETKCL